MSVHLAGDAVVDAGTRTSRHGPDNRIVIGLATVHHEGTTDLLGHFHLRRPPQPATAHEMILRPNSVGIAPSFPSKILTSSPSTRSDTDSKVGDDMVTTREQIDTWTLPCERVLLAISTLACYALVGRMAKGPSPTPARPANALGARRSTKRIHFPGGARPGLSDQLLYHSTVDNACSSRIGS
jgi:hypothetical protein